MSAPCRLPMAALAGVLILALLTAPGCGGGGDDGGASNSPPPVARPEDFPKPNGRSLDELAKQIGRSGPVVLLSVSRLSPGKNRFGFGLFDPSRTEIAGAQAAIYVAPTGGGAALGPFPARFESMAVKPQYQSRTVASDPDAAKSVYVASVDFPRSGQYQVMGVARLDDRLVVAGSGGGPVRVKKGGPIPEVGEKAPAIHTPTTASVGGDQAKIDTRVPLGTMHDVDFADVVGKKPVVLLFATPALCQSRVCGPVVDIAEQVKAETKGGGAAWIHMEIYRDNEAEKGYRPQVTRFGLPSEPWLFTIDRSGRVAALLEGAFSADELRKALDAAVKGRQSR